MQQGERRRGASTVPAGLRCQRFCRLAVLVGTWIKQGERRRGASNGSASTSLFLHYPYPFSFKGPKLGTTSYPIIIDLRLGTMPQTRDVGLSRQCICTALHKGLIGGIGSEQLRQTIGRRHIGRRHLCYAAGKGRYMETAKVWPQTHMYRQARSSVLTKASCRTAAFGHPF
jgi:hypothetical protein